MNNLKYWNIIKQKYNIEKEYLKILDTWVTQFETHFPFHVCNFNKYISFFRKGNSWFKISFFFFFIFESAFSRAFIGHLD